MRPKTMRERTPGQAPLIDGFAFADTRGSLKSSLALSGFARLQDVLGSNAGAVEYEVAGTCDDLGRPALRVKIGGELQLTCQRCLGVLKHHLQVDSLLLLARSEGEIEAEPLDPDSPDRILGGKEMDVKGLLEDEILLAIPVAPHHEQCSRAGEEKGGGERVSPFSGLRGLLDRSGSAKN